MTREYFIGAISGTSMDGVDCALVQFNDNQPIVHAFECHGIPATIRSKLSTLIANQRPDLGLYGSTDIMVGRLFADSINSLLSKQGLSFRDVTAIGSHGQTVWHQPVADTDDCRFTLQIGDPNTIAYRTGITTVADFRRHDMAAGGQGAPLVPAFHRAVFSNPGIPRVILNLGGFANITVLNPADPMPFGFDTGPANVLLDEWIHHSLGHAYDDKGTWSSQGTVIAPLLEQLLSEPYFRLPHPKSTGRELFNLPWLLRQLDTYASPVEPADVQATLSELSAATVSAAILQHLSHGEVLVCGGGIHNTALIERLSHRLPGFRVASTEAYGLHPDCVEAVAFAWFARQTLLGRPIDFAPFTGASRPVIAGGIYRV